MRSAGVVALVALVAVALLLVVVGRARGSATAPGGTSTDGTVEVLDWQMVGVYEHDPSSFTQGLLWHDDRLYESLGNYGRSALRVWDIESGLVEGEVPLDPAHFGEGLVLADGRLVQLTWREGVVYRWSLPDFENHPGWTIDGEGWGLAFDGERFLQTDGSSSLIVRDRQSFEILEVLQVRREGQAVEGLNELEWVDGVLWANVWNQEVLLRIDPADGQVTGVVDLTGLLPPEERAKTDVLNGIAYRPDRNTLLVTGKYWPQLFEIELLP